MNQNLKNYFNKSAATVLSAATLLMTACPLTSAAECVVPNDKSKSISQKTKAIVAATGATAIGILGLAYYLVKSAPTAPIIYVDGLKGKDEKTYELYITLDNMVRENNLDEVQRLLDGNKKLSANAYYININKNNNIFLRSGYTLLHEAVIVGNIKMCELLIEKGADFNIGNKDGYTPLHMAACFGNKEICSLLIAKGANVNAKDGDGETPLHLAAAAEHDKTETCKLLIEKGANVNAKDGYDETPLHLAAAAEHDKTETCKLLIEKGADVNVKDLFGRTPLDPVRDEKTKNLLKELAQNVAQNFKK